MISSPLWWISNVFFVCMILTIVLAQVSMLDLRDLQLYFGP